MNLKQIRNLEKFLPRNIDYFAKSYRGTPVLEGVAYNEDVIYWCPRCCQIHFADRVALPGQYYKQIEQCDKDSIGDVYVIHYYELEDLSDPSFYSFRLLSWRSD